MNSEDRQFLMAELHKPAPAPLPPGALKAKRCKCATPWIERQEDGSAHCCRCGQDL